MRRSSDSSFLASRSDDVSLKSQPSTGLAPVTGPTVVKHPVHKVCPLDHVTPTTAFMTRPAPLDPPMEHVLSNVLYYLFPTPLLEVFLGHRPHLVPLR